MPLPPASSASDRAYTTRWDAAPNSRFFPFIREITLVVERCVSVGEVCVELDPGTPLGFQIARVVTERPSPRSVEDGGCDDACSRNVKNNDRGLVEPIVLT
jgi:hypothetical protein